MLATKSRAYQPVYRSTSGGIDTDKGSIESPELESGRITGGGTGIFGRIVQGREQCLVASHMSMTQNSGAHPLVTFEQAIFNHTNAVPVLFAPREVNAAY